MFHKFQRSRAIPLVVSAATLLLSTAVVAQEPTATKQADTSPGLTALASAAEKEHYAFVFFWKQNDEPTQRMHGVFQEGVSRLATGAEAVSVCVTDPQEAATVKHFGVDRAPLPLVVALAPNGAVTKAWPLKLAAEQLSEGIVSRGTAGCLKGMQEQKLTLLRVHNSETAYNDVASTAVAGFMADERFAAATTLVEIDPADSSERHLLASLKVNPKTASTVTILLSPTGQPIAQFAGAVTTSQLIDKVTAAKTGCCPDGQCGPGGCCPGGNCGPTK